MMRLNFSCDSNHKVPQALKDAQSSTDDAERDIFESCIGLFMFGVPNLGLENTALVTMTEGRRNEAFARGLGNDSQYLPELLRDFSVAFRGRNIKAFSIYETRDSPSVEVSTQSWAFCTIMTDNTTLGIRKRMDVGHEQVLRFAW